MHPWVFVEEFWQDFSHAGRQFRRSPVFFTTAIILIAIGISANAVIFTLVNALLLRPLPVRAPQNLVQVFEVRPNQPPQSYLRYGFYSEIASYSSTLSDVIGFMEGSVSLENDGSMERVYVERVTENYFHALGISPSHGRFFTADDHGAVISHNCWIRTFAGDPSVIGRTVRIEGHPFEIVGITPEAFNGTRVESSADVRVPVRAIFNFTTNLKLDINKSPIEIVARLRPNVSLLQAQQEVEALWNRYQERISVKDANRQRSPDSRLEIRSIERGVSPLRTQFHISLMLLFGGAGLLLLLVCANVGGLLVSRATAREGEVAIRMALGASRGRIARQWLTESLLLTAIGGSIGVTCAYASLPLLVQWIPPVQGRGGELRSLALHLKPDILITVFCIGLCGLVTILAAFSPAWRSSRENLHLALKTTMSDLRQQRLQSIFCAVEVAFCTVLLMSAGLIVRSLSNLRATNTGFDQDHVVTFAIDPHRYTSEQNWSLQRRLIDGVQTLPGVRAAGLAESPVMRGVGMKNTVSLPGQHLSSKDLLNSSTNNVTAGYFDAMGMHLLNGRVFRYGDSDRHDPAPVVVNETFGQRFFPGRDPLGQRFGTGKDFQTPEFEITGIVSNTKYRSLREIPPPIYYTFNWGPTAYPNSFILHVRTHGDPRSIVEPVRILLHSLDAEMLVHDVRTLASEVERSLWQERLIAGIASCFGAFAIALSVIGLYGILAHYVAGHRREVGLRIALGANRSHIIGLISRRLIVTMIAGCSLGGLLSFFISRWVRSLLYGVQITDSASFLIVALSLTFIAIAAAFLPTMRAIAIDPASALKQD